ncbi:hypothetical protein PUN28_002662 [Cardiocondyla obscurior]|uniref:Uncharacterized protein n=1 Tax=Cardiocondyla obscurior TaxID=286306 RepID=A0AAW2GVP7_9HYME
MSGLYEISDSVRRSKKYTNSSAQKEGRHPKLRGGPGRGTASCFGGATFGVGITWLPNSATAHRIDPNALNFTMTPGNFEDTLFTSAL